MNDLTALLVVLAGFAGFCTAASAVYVLNDILDKTQDATHAVKCMRPVADGTIGVSAALIFCLFLCLLTGLFCLLVFQLDYFLIVLMYIVLNILYSFKLQHLPGLNAGCVAAGFVLRVFAGAVIIDVPVSFWLAGLTFLLAMFLTVSKRRCEMICEATAGNNRYSISPGPVMLSLTLLGGYLAYTLSPPVIREHNAPDLYLTSVWVALGLLRYLKVGINRGGDCSPVSVFIKDRPLQICVILWIVTLWWLIYLPGS